MKYFIAIDPQQRYETKMPAARPKQEMHVTLSYLGEKTPKELRKVIRAMKRAAHTSRDFNIKTKGYHDFTGRQPHLEVINSKGLMDLQHKLRNLGTERYRSTSYHPHLTMQEYGLAPRGTAKSRHKFPVNKITLYGVDQSQDMPYKKIKSFKLKDRNIFDKLIDYIRNE